MLSRVDSVSMYTAYTANAKTEGDGKTGKKRTKIGAAFPHREGLGFSIELKAFPLDGRLVALAPDTPPARLNRCGVYKPRAATARLYCSGRT
jgi:hypothetical protein